VLDAVITIDQLAAWLRRFHELVIKNQAELTELDSAIGDADHGINMARGMTAVIDKLEGEQPVLTNDLFKTVAMTLVMSVGGASGPLYGTSSCASPARPDRRSNLTPLLCIRHCVLGSLASWSAARLSLVTRP
jgi:dihydroxyacetone kinase